MLGQGNYRAFLYDRGGARPLGEFTDCELIRFSRVRDDISEGTLRILRDRCSETVATMATGRHELVIFRNGKRAWEGPITRATYSSDGVEVAAKDVMHYAARTIMRRSYDNRYAKVGNKVGPITRRAYKILTTELARKESLDPPINVLRYLDVRTDAETTKTARLTLAYEATVWEELDYMAARLGLDYTTIGRRVIINDVNHVLARTAMLSDKDFLAPLIVTAYGMELCTRSAVTDGQGHWAAVGGVDPYYGEVELLHSTYSEDVVITPGTKPTAEELEALMKALASQAKRNLAGRYPTPTVVRVPDNTKLDPGAAITFEELVPGIRIPTRSSNTALVVQQEQKLDRVVCEWTPKGETISVTLSPSPGVSPWDSDVDTADANEVTG